MIHRQWAVFLEGLYSLQQPGWCPQQFGRAVYWCSVRCKVTCHLQTTAAGLWLLKTSFTLCASAAEWVFISGRCEDVIPDWESCTRKTPCCRCSYTAKLFVRVLVEHSIFCWQGNASKINYTDAILLARVFRNCAAHHNSLVRKSSFRFHCN